MVMPAFPGPFFLCTIIIIIILENEIGGNLNLGLVIGLAVGLGSLAAFIGILLSVRSRKKVSEIQDKYRRVQLIVPVTELEFGEAIGAGSFGEVGPNSTIVHNY